MEPMRIGQRVRVIAERLVHFRQVGTIVALHAPDGYYVHLDYDDDQPEAHVFFHAEELEPAPGVAVPRPRPPSGTAH